MSGGGKGQKGMKTWANSTKSKKSLKKEQKKKMAAAEENDDSPEENNENGHESKAASEAMTAKERAQLARNRNSTKKVNN